MSNPERARDLAARLAAEVGVKTIIAAAKFGHLLLGGSPKLRPPAFDEAEAQRFLSDGAEELAVAEERERAVDPGQPTIASDIEARTAYSTLDSCLISNYAPATSIPALMVPRAESADQSTSALMTALINQVRIFRAVVAGDESHFRYIDELIADSEARAAQHEQVGD